MYISFFSVWLKALRNSGRCSILAIKPPKSQRWLLAPEVKRCPLVFIYMCVNSSQLSSAKQTQTLGQISHTHRTAHTRTVRVCALISRNRSHPAMRPTTSNKPGAAGHGRRVLPAEGGQRGQWQWLQFVAGDAWPCQRSGEGGPRGQRTSHR